MQNKMNRINRNSNSEHTDCESDILTTTLLSLICLFTGLIYLFLSSYKLNLPNITFD